MPKDRIQNIYNPNKKLPNTDWFGLLPVVFTFVFYLPILRNGFVWDDQDCIVRNSYIHSINTESIWWMCRSVLWGNWTPISWLSLALDYQIGKLEPWIYHLDSLFWHSLNTALVFLLALKTYRIIRKIFCPTDSTSTPSWELTGALLAAVFFGLHPIHVESVAWASERKDVLCSFFYLLSLLIYLEHTESTKSENFKLVVCFISFLLALMSKPMAVTLPFILLILDMWLLKRFRGYSKKIFLEKTPFFLASLSISLITIWAQGKTGAIGVTSGLSPSFRLINPFHSLVFYIEKIIWPAHLAVLYPLTQAASIWDFENLFSIFLVLFIFLICSINYKRRPFLMTSWIFYCGTLIPVLGILQVGNQAAADRYTYIPSVGLFLLLAGCISRLLSKRKNLSIFIISLLIVILGSATIRQIGFWKTPITLWENAVNVSGEVSGPILNNLGTAYRSAGQLEKALEIYNKAIVLNPNDVYAYNDKAIDLFLLGRTQESIEIFKTAISLNPFFDSSYFNYWITLQRLGMYPQAVEVAQKWLDIRPSSAKACDLLGISYGVLGNFKKAFGSFEKALALEPNNPEYLNHLAATRHRAQNPKEPLDFYQTELGNLN